MSGPAHAVRLHILLCHGLSGLSRVLNRLTVLGIVPDTIVLRRGPGAVFAHLEVGEAERALVEQLALRLGQFVQVSRLRISNGRRRRR